MLKISLTKNGHQNTSLQLEGRLAGPWVEELKSTCQQLLREGREPQLRLDGVTFVDDDGLALLAQLRREGIVLADCSPFVAEQLRVV